MVTVKKLLKTFKGNFNECEIRIEGSCIKHHIATKNVPRELGKLGVISWAFHGGVMSLYCRVSAVAVNEITAAQLCRYSQDKSLKMIVGSSEPRHVYSTHPVKDAKAIRKWWVDKNGDLRIKVWPW